MNIFGEGFPQEILDQIKYRQQVYGSGYSDQYYQTTRTPDQILYLNSNTSWCKLVSGVNIENLEELNNPTIQTLNLKSNELARKFVLFNGTSEIVQNPEDEYSFSQIQRAGINPNANDLLGGNYAYGIGGSEFGLLPMMGIQSANIKHENRGSLRTAEVKIKAFNRTQFEIIDILYLRLEIGRAHV